MLLPRACLKMPETENPSHPFFLNPPPPNQGNPWYLCAHSLGRERKKRKRRGRHQYESSGDGYRARAFWYSLECFLEAFCLRALFFWLLSVFCFFLLRLQPPPPLPRP